jgi:hypothetical protein
VFATALPPFPPPLLLQTVKGGDAESPELATSTDGEGKPKGKGWQPPKQELCKVCASSTP